MGTKFTLHVVDKHGNDAAGAEVYVTTPGNMGVGTAALLQTADPQGRAHFESKLTEIDKRVCILQVTAWRGETEDLGSVRPSELFLSPGAEHTVTLC